MWRLVLALLALLSSICEKYGFIGVLIFFAVIVLVLGIIAFLAMESDEVEENDKHKCDMGDGVDVYRRLKE